MKKRTSQFDRKQKKILQKENNITATLMVSTVILKITLIICNSL